ncbi:hypothetical protein LC653_40230 [Nostoc sp. CHAB 5784]|uniref:hypothetical protein n=1 Tax=Nostoc mirabile TaxID=2907820 RepID=UPI001E3041CF|nr:hypothetical protein [Nostoc mirabile]MCC5669872.1 hypothetical protein [Nostoc mirabile CHAB5784]
MYTFRVLGLIAIALLTLMAIANKLAIQDLLAADQKLPQTSPSLAKKTCVSIGISAGTKSVKADIFTIGHTLKNCPGS